MWWFWWIFLWDILHHHNIDYNTIQEKQEKYKHCKFEGYSYKICMLVQFISDLENHNVCDDIIIVCYTNICLQCAYLIVFYIFKIYIYIQKITAWSNRIAIIPHSVSFNVLANMVYHVQQYSSAFALMQEASFTILPIRVLSIFIFRSIG